MAARPNTICHLKKGKFIDVNEGFVDSFNWMADSLHNMKGGNNVNIDWQDGSHPVIEATGGGIPQFEGTDGTTTDTSLSGTVKFASAADSNVVVSCAYDTITIGVYYV